MAQHAVRAKRTQPGRRWVVSLLVLTSSIAGILPAYAADEGAAGAVPAQAVGESVAAPEAPPPLRRAHRNMRTRDPAALLTEEQKKKYFQRRPDGSPAKDPQPSVAEWLNVNRPRQPDSSAATAPDPAPK